MKQKKLHFATLVALPLMVSPLIVTMSCSTKGNYFNFDESIFESGSGPSGEGNFSNPLIGTSSNSLTIDKYFGQSSSAEINGENEPLEIKSRKDTGAPKTIGVDPEFLWNWRPVKTTEGLSVTDSKLNMDYVGWNNSDNYWKNPSMDRYWGFVDGEYNRATVELRDRTYGEKLKPTQSAMAKFMFMPNLSWKNANNSLGMVPGITNSSEGMYRAPQYSDVVSIWNPGPIYSVKAPAGSQIDFAHRHGVPILGALLLYARSSGVSENDFKVMLNPGPKGDYPVAKGLAEMSNYIGFDGWFVDWETGQEKQKIQDVREFLKALNSYGKTDQYTKPDGTIVKMTDDPGIVAARKEFNYVPKEQIISSYHAGGNNSDEATSAQQMGDYQWIVQMHGAKTQKPGETWNNAASVVDSDSIITQQVKGQVVGNGASATQWMDFFSANGASNWPEDAQEGTYGIFNAYSVASAQAYGGWEDRKTKEGFEKENMFSQWLWSITNTDLQVDQETFDSYAGDPRVIDKSNDYANRHTSGTKWSISNGFQERTSIIGRNNWTTTFDVGSGLNFNMWGSTDIKKSMVGTSGTGWSSSNMQSHMPTYKFIIDEYNSSNTKTNSLELGANGKITRKINPKLNNTGDAWFGGTTLKYDGKLTGVGSYFTNKLYASNVELKTNDKFKIIIKNTLTDEQITAKKGVIPELAVWTNNNKVTIEKYKSDGTETREFTNTVQDKDGQDTKQAKIGFTPAGHKLHKSVVYEKETSWDVERDFGSIAATSVKKMNGDKWLEVEYDLSSLDGKSLMNFGIKGIQHEESTDFANLEIGQMSYVPTSDSTNTSKPVFGIKSINTDYRWDFASKPTTSVRVSWQTSIADQVADLRGKIRNYFVFYVNDQGQSTGIGYIGANPVAHLTLLDKAKTTQNIRIVGIDEDYNIAISQNATIQLTEGK